MRWGTIFAGLAALLLAGCSAVGGETQTDEPALELTGRVVDAAEILSPEFETALTERLARLEQETLVQLVVATTPSLQGHEIEEYSFKLANAWGIGDAERNDGLLILVAPNERRVRIEVGRGLEQAVKDEEAFLIIKDSITPHFRTGDYESGVSAGVDGLVSEVSSPELKEAA